MTLATECPVPVIPSNVQMSCGLAPSSPASAQHARPIGIVCLFSCGEGHELQGAFSMMCMNPGKWSSDPPTCTGTKFNFTHMGKNVFCVTKSPIIRNNNITPPPTALKCPMLEAPQNGQINCSSSELAYNSECFFSCDKDYALRGHELLTCDRHGNWTGEKPTCQGKISNNKSECSVISF